LIDQGVKLRNFNTFNEDHLFFVWNSTYKEQAGIIQILKDKRCKNTFSMRSAQVNKKPILNID
jgi:hypothetical protein